MRELSDEEIFGSSGQDELSDDEVFGGSATPAPAPKPAGFLSELSAAVKGLFSPRKSVLEAVATEPNPSFDFNTASRVARAVDDGVQLPLPRTIEGDQARIADQAALDRDKRAGMNRRRFANENPVMGGAASGAAQALAGAINIPTAAADLLNQTAINPILKLAGLQPLQRPVMPGTDSLQQLARDYSPAVAQPGLTEAWEGDQFGTWLMANLAQQSPQMAQSLTAAFVPGLRPVLLPGMGATAAGTSYAQGDDSRVAAAKGLVEVGTEMLPLGAFDRVGAWLAKQPAEIQRSVVAEAGRRLLASGAAVTANSITGAIEEAAAQVGGNALDKYAAGKNVGLLDDVDKSAVLGAAGGAAMSAPQVAGTLAGPGQKKPAPSPEPTLADYQDMAARVFGAAPQARAPQPAPVQQQPAPAPQTQIEPATVNSVVDAIKRAVPGMADNQAPEQPVQQAPAAELSDAEVFDQAEPAAQVSQAAPVVDAVGGAGDSQPLQPAPTAPRQQAQPVQQQQAQAKSDNEPVGRDFTPIAQGGKPFKTKAEASTARKLQPHLRVKSAADGKGFILVPATQAQLAAAANAAKRIKGARTGTADKPMSAHEFIVGKGGLDGSARADTVVDGNPRVGNRFLFAGKGKQGLTLAQAAELLHEAGYIKDESETAAAEVIKRSLTSPQYNAEGWERIAQAEHAAKFEDHLAAQQEQASNPFVLDDADLADTGYSAAAIELQEQTRALRNLADQAGVDSDSIMEELARQFPDVTEEVFYEHAKAALTAATEEAEQGSHRADSPDDGARVHQEARGSEEGAGTEGLTSYTPDELRERQAQQDQAAADKARTDREAEQRAQADAERDTFTLTGSDREADQAAARGQGGLFDAAPEPAAQPASEPAKSEAKQPLPIPEEAFAELLQESADQAEEEGSHVFREPEETVRIEAAAGEFIELDQAEAEVEGWKQYAKQQGETGANADKVVISLFDASGTWAKPWADAGYQVHTFDIQDGTDINDFSVEYLQEQLGLDTVDVILAAPPCTDFSSSGAHAWAKKDADGRTAASIKLVKQTLRTVEYFKPTVWSMENPVGRIARLNGLPKPALTFQPHNFGDPYTKRTMLWGNMATDLPTANVEPTDGSKVAKLTSTDKYGRSLTPEGFAYAFFMANNLADLGVAGRAAVAFGMPKDVVQQAIDAGVPESDVQGLIEDAFYQDLDDVASATKKLRALMKKHAGKPGDKPAAEQADDKPASEMSTAELLRAAADKLEGKPPKKARGKKRDEPAADKPVPAATIADAGEKIGGARKDRWKDRGLDLSDLDAMSESEGAELATKANVWKPDYEALAKASEPVTAAMVKSVYDQLAAKPKDNTPEGRRRYVRMMQAVRQVYTEAKSPEDVRNAYLKVRELAGLNTDDGEAKKEARAVLFSVYKGRSDPFVLGYNELAKAKKLVEDGFPSIEPWRTRFTLRGLGGAGTTARGIELYTSESNELGMPLTEDQVRAGAFAIKTKAGKTVGYAATQQEAEEVARELYGATKGKKDSKEEPSRPHLDSMQRDGLPQRIDRDVTPDDFLQAMGFRGVEFGNWSAQDERQRIINMAYDGLLDLAEIMGIPPKAMSLNGTMGLAFGARGGGKFAAHYEPGKLVINMTKLRGGGSLAHEWAHALDHYFGELDRQDAYKTGARGASGWTTEGNYDGKERTRHERVGNEWVKKTSLRLDNLRPELAKAWDAVMRAMFSGHISKAQRVRELEQQVELYQGYVAKELDPKMKASYEQGLEGKKAELEEVRAAAEGTTYPRGHSAYASEARKLSGKSTDGYWLRPTEMLARGFESWVFDRIKEKGGRSDYLVHGVEADRYADETKYKGNPYPVGVERERINAAFDDLAKALKVRETDKGTALYSVADAVDEGTKKADNAAHGRASGRSALLVAQLRESLLSRRAEQGAAPLWHAVVPAAGAPGTGARAVAKIAREFFGREVVYVKFDGKPLFNGAVSKNAPSVIFLNIEAQKPLMAVLGHELLHELAKTNPQAYAKLSMALDSLIQGENEFADRERAKYRKQGLDPTNTDFREELEADIVGDNFMEPEFWKALAKEQPGYFKRIANAIIEWLDAIAHKLGLRNPFGTDAFLKDVAAARAAVADAMREFSGTQVGAVTGSQSERLSVADQDEPADLWEGSEEEQQELPLPEPDGFKARDLLSLERDTSGRLIWTAGRKGYEAGMGFARSLLGGMKLMDTKPGAFRDLMRKYQADNYRAQQSALEVAQAGKDVPPEMRRLLSDIIEGEAEAGADTPESIMEMAGAMQSAFEHQAQQLIELGMLTDKRKVANYLPRVYRNPLIGKLQSREQVMAMLTKVRMRIRGDRLKSRGLTTLVPPGRVKDMERLGWKLSSMPDGEPVPVDLRSAIEKGRPVPGRFNEGQKVLMWRDFTKTEREEMGEVRDAFIRFAMGYVETQKDLALGRLFNGIANDRSLASPFNPGGWVKVPKKEIIGTDGVLMYGNLSGMYVEPQVADALKRAVQDKSAITEAYDKALSLWKEGKTVWNPVAHGNNVVSNLFMAHFAGLNIANPMMWREVLKDYRIKGRYYQEAVEHGLLGTEFANTEIQNALMPELAEFMTEADVVASRVTKVAEFLKRYPGKPVTFYREKMQKAYEFEDQIFKLMVYIDRRKAGAEPGAAIDDAERYFFNYADAPEGIRNVQRFWSPFFSYTYNVIPALLYTASTRPDRLALPLALLGGMNWLAYAILGDDGDEEEERRNMPDYMKGRTALGSEKSVRLPFNSAEGNPYFLDMSRRIPGGDMMDFDNQMGGMPWAAPFMPSHPVLHSTYMALWGNKDTFTGRALVKESDTGWEAAKKRAGYLYRQAVPNAIFVPGSHAFNKTMEAAAAGFDRDMLGYTGYNSQGDRAKPGIAALDVLGVAKVREANVERNEDFRLLDLRREVGEIRANISSLRRAESKNGQTGEDKAASERRTEEQIALQREKLERLRERVNQVRGQ